MSGGTTRPGWARAFNLTVGLRLRDLRLEAGDSMSSLARRAGLSTTVIWRIERGDRGARTETWAKIAAALGMEPGELRVRLSGDPRARR